MRERLLEWYDGEGRRLPWRGADPYRVWLSEIMLQQTTVPHAAPYYETFTRRWPTVEALAAAEDGEVMAAWAGLGYYARARNLLACAREVAARGGMFPDTEEGLRTLPGVGGYTAAAIAAFAFGRPANVVDANVERIMARLFAVETPLPAAKAELTALSAQFVSDHRPGDLPQALMDLGATVCRPKQPDCLLCPLRAECQAFAQGDPGAYPRRAEKPPKPHRHGAVFKLWHGETIALVRRPPKGLLGGMLGLPTTDWTDTPPTANATSAAAPALGPWRRAGEISHSFTHFDLTLAVWEGRTQKRSPSFEWMTPEAARGAVPSLFKKAI
jgi:A/G-specific adenine glycosylase